MLELPPPPNLHPLSIRHKAAYGFTTPSLSRSSRKENSPHAHKSEISPPSTCPDNAEGKLFSPPQPVRGRTLRRPMQNSISTANKPRRDSPPSLPPPFSPPQVMRVAIDTTLADDEMLFQMSPVVSPKHSAFFEVQNPIHRPARSAAQQALAERWDVQAKFMLGSYSERANMTKEESESRALDSSNSRSYVAQHHRVRSALVVGAHSDVTRCSTKDGRTRFDCSDCSSPTSNDRSPPNVRSSKKQPFLYNFPTFDSSSISTVPIPIHHNGSLQQTVFGSSPELTDSNVKLTGMGPIRARNLRIQSGSSLITSDELATVHSGEEEAGDDFIPGTFSSEILDDFEHQHLADEEEEGYAISQPCSSSSTSSLSSGSVTSSNGTEFDDSDVIPKSLLASFPVRHVEAESEPASLKVHVEEERRSLPRAARFFLGDDKTMEGRRSANRNRGSCSSRQLERTEG